MIQWIFILILSLLGSMSLARTNSYFTMTGDRVMINIQSGHAFNPSNDEDAVRLFNAMDVAANDSMMGKGKKIEWKTAFSLIVAHRGQSQYDGTLMLYRWPGIQIDYSRRIAEVRWTGEEASYMFEHLKHDNGSFDYTSADGRLKVYSDQNQFNLTYSEYQ